MYCPSQLRNKMAFGITRRLPRVSFRTERPFIAGTMITFGLITYLHHSLYSKRTISLQKHYFLIHNFIRVVKSTGKFQAAFHR